MAFVFASSSGLKRAPLIAINDEAHAEQSLRMRRADQMPNPPKHFKFNAPIGCADKASPRLHMAAVPDLLAKGGAWQVPMPRHPRAPQDLSGVTQERQSRILLYHELKSLKGIPYSRVHVRRLEKAGEFPRRIQISRGRMGWYEHEIDEWLRKKADARV